jgi:hypothetical protein
MQSDTRKFSTMISNEMTQLIGYLSMTGEPGMYSFRQVTFKSATGKRITTNDWRIMARDWAHFTLPVNGKTFLDELQAKFPGLKFETEQRLKAGNYVHTTSAIIVSDRA